MELTFFFLTVADILGIFMTTAYAVFLGLNARTAGIGRILFWSLISLKFWASMILVYFFVNTYYPTLLGDYRLYIRLFFGLYLFIQPIGVGIAFGRWHFHSQE